MNARAAVAVAGIAAIMCLSSGRVLAASSAHNMYIILNFDAISDTLRDTTLASSSTATPTTSATLAVIMASGPITYHTMFFKIFVNIDDPDRLALWGDTLQSVPMDQSGNVHVVLGVHKTLDWSKINSHPVVYLEVTIDGNVYSPRLTMMTSGIDLELDFMSGGTPDGSVDTMAVANTPLILAVSGRAHPAISVNRKAKTAQAIVFSGVGGDPIDNAVRARMSYELSKQQAILEVLRAENARLRAMVPSTKKNKKEAEESSRHK
jgi:hypothetical protein